MKSEKKKKKKRSSPLFITFPTSIFNFPPSLFPFLQFSSFLLNFHPFSLFSLPLFPYTSAKICQSEISGALFPPACYATDPTRSVKENTRNNNGINNNIFHLKKWWRGASSALSVTLSTSNPNPIVIWHLVVKIISEVPKQYKFVTSFSMLLKINNSNQGFLYA